MPRQLLVGELKVAVICGGQQPSSEESLCEADVGDAACDTSSYRFSTVDADQTTEQPPHGDLLFAIEGLVDGLRRCRNRRRDPAGLSIGVDRQQVALDQAPGFGQGVRQQGECPGLIATLGDQDSDEPGLELQVGVCGRPLDDGSKSLFVERAEHVHVALDQLDEPAVLRQLVEEVGANDNDHLSGMVGEAIEEVALLGDVGALCDRLLRLVDDDQGFRPKRSQRRQRVGSRGQQQR